MWISRLRVLGPTTAAFILLMLVAVTAQTAGSHWRPPLNVVEIFGARLVDVAAGEWWRLLSGAFFSSLGWPHALINVGGVLLVTRPLERSFGSRQAVAVLVTSSMAAYAAGAWVHGVHWLSAGGSGAVLGCAGFLAVRWKEVKVDGRWGVAVVALFTFGGPIVFVLLGQPSRGSFPAHAGGFAAGAVAAGLSAVGVKIAVTVAGGVVTGVASLAPLAVHLLPETPKLIGCDSSVVSTADGSDTRLLFLNPSGRDVGVRSLSPAGDPGRTFEFGPERRGRMPWYGYAGAVYEVVDGHGACVLRARATRGTSTVVVPPDGPNE